MREQIQNMHINYHSKILGTLEQMISCINHDYIQVVCRRVLLVKTTTVWFNIGQQGVETVLTSSHFGE